MKPRVLLLAGALLVLLCSIALIIPGRTCTLNVHIQTKVNSPDDLKVTLEQEGEVVRLTEKKLSGDTLFLTFQSVSKGKAHLDVKGPDDFSYLDTLYVHAFGVITVNTYFGISRGSWLIPIVFMVLLVFLLIYVILQYRADMKQSIYQYRNIRNLGWIIYLISMIISGIRFISSDAAMDNIVRDAINGASAFSFFALPLSFLVSLLVIFTSIRLIRREGRSWRNMLALMLSLLVCFSTILPYALAEFLQRTTLVDVHNERGAALYIEMAVENIVLVSVTYLECILLAAMILTILAGRRIPAFDKDYILILGCQVRKDGTPTPLLRGRADRAVAFAGMQKEAAGRDLVFVPSGGQGSDEVVSEAESIRRYLLSAGIPPEKILPEDRSTSTEENIRNSMQLIREAAGPSDPKIAFSTTSYHVFRAGVLARQQGVPAEGIGSKTRSYFWINAFVREFMAAIYSERKHHLLVIAGLILMILVMVMVIMLSNML